MTPRLLFADDSLTMHRVVQITFARQDMALAMAHSGAEAIALGERERFDVALIDLDLGDLDGYAVCERLLRQRPGAPFPVLLLTSDHHPVDEARRRACGAVGSLKKPFETQSAVQRVLAALTEGAAHVALEPHPAAPPVQHEPPRPAFFAAPPPIPQAAATPPPEPVTVTPEPEAWAVHQGGPPAWPQPVPDRGVPQASDLPELPTWSLDLDAPPAAPAAPAHEPLWSEKESVTAEDLRRPSIDPAIVDVARAEAASLAEPPPRPQEHAPAVSTHAPELANVALAPQEDLAEQTRKTLAQALAPVVAHTPGLDAEHLAQALAPKIIEVVERVLWEIGPAWVAQAASQPPPKL